MVDKVAVVGGVRTPKRDLQSVAGLARKRFLGNPDDLEARHSEALAWVDLQRNRRTVASVNNGVSFGQCGQRDRELHVLVGLEHQTILRGSKRLSSQKDACAGEKILSTNQNDRTSRTGGPPANFVDLRGKVLLDIRCCPHADQGHRRVLPIGRPAGKQRPPARAVGNYGVSRGKSSPVGSYRDVYVDAG